MKVLFIGDIVGRSGRRAVASLLPELANEYSWDLCIANAENAAGGRGITPAIAEELLAYGIDVLTMGNHTWDNKDIFQFIDSAPYLVRPANYPIEVPGQGYTVVEKKGKKIAVLNLSGQVFMGPMDCPFAKADQLISSLSDCDHIFIDFHAEATAEKVGFARYVDGRAAAVVGTHTIFRLQMSSCFPGGHCISPMWEPPVPLIQCWEWKSSLFSSGLLLKCPSALSLPGGRRCCALCGWI